MRNKSALQLWVLGADLVWVCLAMAIALVARYGTSLGGQTARSLSWSFGPELVSALVLWLFFSSSKNLDGFSVGWWLPSVVSHVSVAAGTLMLVMLAGEYLARNYTSRLVLIYFGSLLITGFVAIRYAIYRIIVARRRAGSLRRVVIVGSDKMAAEVASKIEMHPEMAWEVVGFLYPDSEQRCDELKDYGDSATVQPLGIMDLLRDNRVDELVLLNPQSTRHEVLNLVALCRNAGIQVSVVPPLYELYLSQAAIVDLGGFPILRFEQHRTHLSASAAKRVVDVALGALLMVVALPIVGVSAIILRVTKGRAFRRELRCGQHGKPFSMYRLNVDRLAPHASSLERFLDATSIAELPNLLNVFTGDMSLVGPRPESFDRAQRYSDWTRQRLNAKPGITGLAQVHGLRDQHSSDEKAYFDLQYCLKQSVFSDFTLIVQTVWTLAARALRRHRMRCELPVMFPDRPTEVFASANSSQSSAD
jgi:lipopolysaccharide/colanic/teichoic acid biosynthesis glycosyltransferase